LPGIIVHLPWLKQLFNKACCFVYACDIMPAYYWPAYT